MKTTALFILILVLPAFALGGTRTNDSLLKVLDKVILERTSYTEARERAVEKLKHQKSFVKNSSERYEINKGIIDKYNSFVFDSAEHYVKENLAIAYKTGNQVHILENKLHLSYIYSLSGLFLQALELLDSLDYNSLPTHLKVAYCWNRIRLYENLITYTGDARFSSGYKEGIDDYRSRVMQLLYNQSDEYRKECAFKFQQEGKFEEAADLLLPIFNKQEPGTHGFAMAAMSMAKNYKLQGLDEKEQYYLTLAAITDLQLAVKENEALLSLAVKLYGQNDIDRAYNYIKVALEDALYYNARFKNSVISRVQHIIEATYLKKIESQQRSLKLYSILTSVFVVILLIALFFNFIHNRALNRAKRELRSMNDKLLSLNTKLDEANIVKEKYIGYFMTQSAMYISKLDEFRRTVNRKIKVGQIDSLVKSSTAELEKEMEELFANFDVIFLKLFPNFIPEFNELLKPEERYKFEEEGKLNAELRIYALMRLGITDVCQIAVFLRYSVQTVYNYKSKVKGKLLIPSEHFDEKIRKIGSVC